MSRNSVITAIDLGTDKCVTLIADVQPETKSLRVVGVAAVPARGMRRSVIVDLEQVLMTISESLDAAERMAGFDVQSAYVSVSGAHVSSKNSKGVVAVAAPDQEITDEDVARVVEAARAISLPADRQILHVIPKDFKVDSQEGIKDPVGMTGVRLESEAHIITGMSTSLRNLEKCINDLGLQVDSFVFAGLAAAEVVLSETEKELGVVAIDIGAGSTSFSAFVEGALEYSGAIPIGARHITQDLALGCRISLDSAEKIKLALTNDYQEIKPRPGESKEDLNKRRKKADKLDLAKLGIHETVESLSKRTLVERIMLPRMKEIIHLVGQKLDDKDLLNQVPAGLVLSGGGAETVGMTEVAKRTLNLPARVGQPKELQGLVTDIMRPSYATSIGLLVYGQRHGGGAQIKTSLSLDFLKQLPVKSAVTSLIKLVKKIMP
ncbi:MAG: cell division protein FtsA [Candidatus Pacebacteria bacterium]|nr:cell division protein FtsA [Candidatus Paceibacterota bacterium]